MPRRPTSPSLLDAIRDADVPRLQRLLGSLAGPAHGWRRVWNLWQRWRRQPMLNAALFLALQHQCVEEVALLAPLGSRQAEDDQGRTPLMLAALAGRADLVALLMPFSDLLRRNLDPDVENNGRTALLYAIRYGHLDVVRTLLPAHLAIQDPDLHVALMRAAWQGHPAILALMLPHLDPTQPDQHGTTPLMKAAEQGHLECVEQLIPYGATCAINHRQDTALMRAAAGGHEKVVVALLPRSDPASRNVNAKTALHEAAFAGHAGCLRRLIPVSDARAQDQHGWTPLMFLAKRPAPLAAIEALLPVSDQAQINDVGETAFTMALERARDRGHHVPLCWEVLDLLAVHHPDPDRVHKAFDDQNIEAWHVPRWTAAREREALMPLLEHADVSHPTGRRRL